MSSTVHRNTSECFNKKRVLFYYTVRCILLGEKKQSMQRLLVGFVALSDKGTVADNALLVLLSCVKPV